MNRAVSCGLILSILLVSGCGGTTGPVRPSTDGPEEAGTFFGEGGTTGSNVEREFDEATALLRAGEYQRGLEMLERLLRERDARKNAALHINRGIAYEKLGKLEQAEEALKTALAIEPAHPVANNEYGMVLRRSGRFAEARAAYEKALDAYPGFLPARRNLGILCDLYLRDLECAMRQYQTYAAAVPEDKSVAAWIADLQQKMTTGAAQ